MICRALDLDALHEQFVSATPFRHVVIEDFLRPELAEAVHRKLRHESDVVTTVPGFLLFFGAFFSFFLAFVVDSVE